MHYPLVKFLIILFHIAESITPGSTPDFMLYIFLADSFVVSQHVVAIVEL